MRRHKSLGLGIRISKAPCKLSPRLLTQAPVKWVTYTAAYKVDLLNLKIAAVPSPLKIVHGASMCRQRAKHFT